MPMSTVERLSPTAPLCQPPAAPAPVPLTEAVACLEREARWGTCDTGRYRCPYYVWGDGPTLTFIAGLSDDARSFVLPAYYLRHHFRCVAYDLPSGRGDGARLARYRHADYVDDLFDLLDHVGAGQSFLYGLSFGSTVALAALARQPQRLPRAVVQGGFAQRRLAVAEQLLCRVARYWPGAMHRLPWRQQALRHAHFEPFAHRPPEVWQYFVERLGTPPIAAVTRRALVMHQTDLRPLLPRIQQPVLVVCGDRDPLVNQACEEVLLAGLPHATRVEVRNAGHWPILSHPEVVAELVFRFLTPLPACGIEQACAGHG
jgi:pimeloyl-ACP methyl ester carboxylesterase